MLQVLNEQENVQYLRSVLLNVIWECVVYVSKIEVKNSQRRFRTRGFVITEKRLCGSAVGGSSANPISQLFSNLDISLKAGMRRISAPPNIRSASPSLHPSTCQPQPPFLPLPYTPNPPSCPPPPCTPSILLLPILNSHAPKIPLPRVHRDISHVITRRPDQR